MKILFLLIAASVLLALIFLGLFFWSVKSGQNDDLVSPGIRVLFDDKKIDNKTNQTNKSN